MNFLRKTILFIEKKFLKVSALFLLSILVVFVLEIFISLQHRKSEEKLFIHVCKLINPRLQLGAYREVQDTLISIFSDEIHSSKIFPIVSIDGKQIIEKPFETTELFQCDMISANKVYVNFYTNSFSISNLEKISFSIILTALFFIFSLSFETINNRRVELKYEHELNKSIAQIATQVAHDLRSPIMAIQIVANKIDFHENDHKQLILNASMRVSQIANGLLENAKSLKLGVNKNLHETTKIDTNFGVFTSINKIVEEKKTLAPHINFKIFSEEKLPFINAEKIDFERIISNLIQNSIESVVNLDRGEIEIHVRLFKSTLNITIVDNGCGIPEKILKNIGDRGLTYNKLNGNGLGTFYAKERMARWGGAFSISSKENEGTLVNLKFNIVANQS